MPLESTPPRSRRGGNGYATKDDINRVESKVDNLSDKVEQLVRFKDGMMGTDDFPGAFEGMKRSVDRLSQSIIELPDLIDKQLASHNILVKAKVFDATTKNIIFIFVGVVIAVVAGIITSHLVGR